MSNWVKPTREVVDLFISMHEVHETIVMVVVVRTFGSIHWKHKVVTAKTVALGVLVTEYSSLQQFVVTVVDAGDDESRAECQLFVFIEEVVGVSVQDHAADWLEGEEVLRPDFGDIKGVKVAELLPSSRASRPLISMVAATPSLP